MTSGDTAELILLKGPRQVIGNWKAWENVPLYNLSLMTSTIFNSEYFVPSYSS